MEHAGKKLLMIKKKALKLADEGKLQEAIESMISDMDNLFVLAGSPLPFDMVFAFDEKMFTRMKEKAFKLTNEGKINEAVIDNLISSLLHEVVRPLPKIGFIMGMAAALQKDPHLTKQRVKEWIGSFEVSW